jgi:hypothetical protein
MKRLILAASAVGLVGLTLAFGLTMVRGQVVHGTGEDMPALAVGAVAGPPEEPCVFPSLTELTELAGVSDLVVAGTVQGRAQVFTYSGINQPFTRYVIRVRSVLRGPAVSGVLTLEEAGGVVQPILNPGPQVVFLQRVQHSDGLTTYFVENGLGGIFLTRASGMTRECPHGVARASEFVSNGESEVAFGDQVRQLTATTPPHK